MKMSENKDKLTSREEYTEYGEWYVLKYSDILLFP
jgi:hypothetical protein